MKLSTKGQYGTRALLDLALHNNEAPVLLKDIAQRQQISPRYLGQLVIRLTAGGLVRSRRGPGGGVSLAKTPEEIKLIDIIQLLEGPIAPVDCVDNPEVCNRSKLCAARDVWGELKEAMEGVLKSTSLQDLVERQKVKEHIQEMMYNI